MRSRRFQSYTYSPCTVKQSLPNAVRPRDDTSCRKSAQRQTPMLPRRDRFSALKRLSLRPYRFWKLATTILWPVAAYRQCSSRLTSTSRLWTPNSSRRHRIFLIFEIPWITVDLFIVDEICCLALPPGTEGDTENGSPILL